MDKRQVEDILKEYNLSPQTKLVDVEVREGQTKLLTAMPKPEERDKLVEGAVFKIIKQASLKDLEKYIGVPDDIAKLRTHPNMPGNIGPASWRTSRRQPVAITFGNSMLKPETATSYEKQALKEMAREYIFGDSKKVSSDMVKVIENFYHDREIAVFPLRNITVWPEANFVISQDVNVLLANKIKIYSGGKITNYGYLKINCVSLHGN